MSININDVEIDWVKIVPRGMKARTTDHTIMDRGDNVISTSVAVSSEIKTLNCMIKDSFSLNPFAASDKDERFERLIEIGNSKEMIEFSTKNFTFFKFLETKSDKTFVITSISETDKGTNFIAFNLVLKEIKLAKLKTIKTSIMPAKLLKKSASKAKKKKLGLSGLKNLGIKSPKYP